IDDCLADVLIHLVAFVVASFRLAADAFEVVIEESWTSSYTGATPPHVASPALSTAARLRGQVVWSEGVVLLDLRCAKGAPDNGKSVRLVSAEGAILHVISLNESGHEAHARLLQELVQVQPTMPLSVADAVSIVQVIDRAREMAQHRPP